MTDLMISSVDFKDLENLAIRHKAKIDTSKNDIIYNLEQIKKEQESLNSLTSNLNTLRYSYEYLDKLVKEESGKFIKKLNDILDYGIKTIIFDKDYSVDIRVSDNNKATIHLVYEDDNGYLVEPEIGNCGGGIRTIVGVLMQIFFILLYKCEPILFLDEALSQVSSTYLPNFFGLLKEMADKNDLKILLITHDVRFNDYADRVYKVKDGHVLEIDGGKNNE